MPTYDEWNEALAHYFLQSTPRGAAVFLSVDEEILCRVARELDSGASTDPEVITRQFCATVCPRACSGSSLDPRIFGRDASGVPRGVAFLATMVLAALRMERDEDEEISEQAYFIRLCSVLGLPEWGGRPDCLLPAGVEEPLWYEWNRWLKEKGYLASARPGVAKYRFINYPISQALLRATDRQKLCRLFDDEEDPARNLDVDTLFQRVWVKRDYLPKHLREILKGAAGRRAAVAEAIYDTYLDWRRMVHQGSTGGSSQAHAGLPDAGLYRREDPFAGRVDYLLLPGRRHRHHADQARIEVSGKPYTLVPDRVFWYRPTGSVTAEELTHGARYPLQQPAPYTAVSLPQRKFWVLVDDPENPDAAVFASWGRPRPGDQFYLLCRTELIRQLDYLRKERLIQWSGEPKEPLAGSDWVEFERCQVISNAWDGISIPERELFQTLRPQGAVPLNVSLAGGLRAPDGSGWLLGCGPAVTIYGYLPEAEVTITRASDDRIVSQRTCATNSAFAFDWAEAGDYQIDATCERGEASRVVKIVAWDALTYTVPESALATRVRGLSLCGALILDKE